MAASAFLGGAYTLRSLPLAAQTCINLYVEPNEAGNGEPGCLYGTPGKRRLATLATAGCRGLFKAGGALWGVYGAKLYKITSAWAATEVGTIPGSGPVVFAENGIDLVIAHSEGWHAVVLATDALAAVTGSEPTTDVCFIDNYFVGCKADGSYQWADVATTTIDALSFASAEGHPDRVLRCLADHRELWLFGEVSVEVAVVTTDPDLPFTRTAFIEQGILAPLSAAKEDNSVFWLGRNESGQGVVYRAQGYVPTRVSTFAIEQAIQTYANPDAATAYTYQQDGHHFYVLSFAEATWALDINTGLWHQRAYRDTTTGELKRDRAAAHCFFAGAHVAGDWEDGRLYALDLETYTDDGDPIYRERTWAQLHAENRLIRFDRGELIAEMGTGLSGDVAADEANPTVWLSWSDDGGRNWSNEHERNIGPIGQFRNRAIWRRMGRARSRYYRLRTSTATRVAWRAFNLDMEVANR